MPFIKVLVWNECKINPYEVEYRSTNLFSVRLPKRLGIVQKKNIVITRGRIRPEVRGRRYRFVKDIGRRNAIVIIRMLSEQLIWV